MELHSRRLSFIRWVILVTSLMEGCFAFLVLRPCQASSSTGSYIASYQELPHDGAVFNHVFSSSLSTRRQKLLIKMTAGAESSFDTGSTPLPRAVIIIPGYASDASLYKTLQSSIRARGLPCWTVPITGQMWAPTFGGRSIRPILDRIHETVLNVALKSRPLPSTEEQEIVYETRDFVREMADPSKGAQSVLRAQQASSHSSSFAATSGCFPSYDETFDSDQLRYDIALVGHSAGGWCARIYLSTTSYDGLIYNGARFVHTLITLGSPHIFPEKYAQLDAVPYALRNLKLVNEKCSGSQGGSWEDKVRIMCVGSNTVKGKAFFKGLFKDWAGASYELCGYDGGVEGDGITPLESSLGIKDAELVSLEGIYHGPEVESKGQLWYGSDPYPLEKWIGFLLQDDEASSEAARGGHTARETGGGAAKAQSKGLGKSHGG